MLNHLEKLNIDKSSEDIGWIYLRTYKNDVQALTLFLVMGGARVVSTVVGIITILCQFTGAAPVFSESIYSRFFSEKFETRLFIREAMLSILMLYGFVLFLLGISVDFIMLGLKDVCIFGLSGPILRLMVFIIMLVMIVIVLVAYSVFSRKRGFDKKCILFASAIVYVIVPILYFSADLFKATIVDYLTSGMYTLLKDWAYSFFDLIITLTVITIILAPLYFLIFLNLEKKRVDKINFYIYTYIIVYIGILLAWLYVAGAPLFEWALCLIIAPFAIYTILADMYKTIQLYKVSRDLNRKSENKHTQYTNEIYG